MKAIAQFTIRDETDITVGAIAPTNPVKDELWLDTSVEPSKMKRWNGTTWDIVNDTSDLEDGIDSLIEITKTQSTKIEANAGAIKLKVDDQTYQKDKTDMTSKLEKNTSEIGVLKGQIALKVEHSEIENLKGELEGTMDSKITTAKGEIKVTTDKISQDVSKLTTDVSNKADGSVVTEMNTKIGKLETSVEGIKGEVTDLSSTITTKADKDSVYTTTQVDSKMAEIKATTDKISLGLSQTQSSVETVTKVADSKAKIFTTQPVPPYKLGDLWVQGASGEMMRCITARATGTFTASDWDKASKYTDDTVANAVKGELTTVKSDVAGINIELGKITTKVGTVESTANTAKSTADSAKSLANTANTNATNANNKADALDANLNEQILGVHDTIAQVSAENIQTAEEIFKKALEDYVTTGDYESAYKALSTQLEQTSERFDFIFNKVEGEITEGLDGLEQITSQLISYISFDNGSIILGNSASSFSVRITNERIQFMDAGNEVAYISNQKLFITDAHVTHSLQIGSFKWIPRDNGNTSFTWVG